MNGGPPSSIEVKNTRSFTSISPSVFMSRCLIKGRVYVFIYLNLKVHYRVHMSSPLDLSAHALQKLRYVEFFDVRFIFVRCAGTPTTAPPLFVMSISIPCFSCA